MRLCSKCKLTKSETSFYKHSARRDGIDEICMHCKKQAVRAGNGTIESYLRKIARRAQIPYSDVAQMWRNQNGLCAITQFPLTHTPSSLPQSIYNAHVCSVSGTQMLVCARISRMHTGLTSNQLLKFCAAVVENSDKFLSEVQ
jgi:hypothetical protein